MRYNLLFFAQGLIAQECLRYVSDSRLLIKGIVTNTNFFKENSNVFSDSIFISNEEKNEVFLLEFIKSKKINLIISIQHPWILSDKIIDSVNGFAFNLHNATIPDYKGHNTISHAILNGEKVYGTTMHWIISEVDMGEIVCTEETDIVSDETAYSLYQKMLKLSCVNFRRFIGLILSGQDLPRVKFKGKGKFYSKYGLSDLKKINNPSDLVEVDRKFRAFFFPPHEPAYIDLGQRKLYLSLEPYPSEIN